MSMARRCSARWPVEARLMALGGYLLLAVLPIPAIPNLEPERIRRTSPAFTMIFLAVGCDPTRRALPMFPVTLPVS